MLKTMELVCNFVLNFLSGSVLLFSTCSMTLKQRIITDALLGYATPDRKTKYTLTHSASKKCCAD
jgi:hypothetical protein